MQVNMLEAKTQLSKLVEAALRGEDVVIANRGRPAVRLVKVEPQFAGRRPGVWEGLMSEQEIDDAFSPEADAELARALYAGVERIARRPPNTPARKKARGSTRR